MLTGSNGSKKNPGKELLSVKLYKNNKNFHYTSDKKKLRDIEKSDVFCGTCTCIENI